MNGYQTRDRYAPYGMASQWGGAGWLSPNPYQAYYAVGQREFPLPPGALPPVQPVRESGIPWKEIVIGVAVGAVAILLLGRTLR